MLSKEDVARDAETFGEAGADIVLRTRMTTPRERLPERERGIVVADFRPLPGERHVFGRIVRGHPGLRATRLRSQFTLPPPA